MDKYRELEVGYWTLDAVHSHVPYSNASHLASYITSYTTLGTFDPVYPYITMIPGVIGHAPIHRPVQRIFEARFLAKFREDTYTHKTPYLSLF